MYLDREDIIRLASTQNGRDYLKLYFARARTAFGVNQIFHYLEQIGVLCKERPLSPEEQQNTYNVLWWSLHEAPHSDIKQYCKDATDWNEPDTGRSC